jgi:NADH-quinone oxidoreductase subunit D
VQIIAELDGERVVRTDVHCGYLHRGFEKECESHTWHNLIPYVDRLNYVSALINDFAYCDAVEQLMGVRSRRAAGTCARCCRNIRGSSTT